MATPARRSGRQRKENTKYANGGWDKKTLKALRESSESSNPTSPEGSEQEQAESDQNFSAAEVEMLEEAAEIDEDDSSSPSEKSGSASVVTLSDDDDKMSIVSFEHLPNSHLREAVSRTEGDGKKAAKDQEFRSRGQIGKKEFRTERRDKVHAKVFGPELDDLEIILLSRDTWQLKARDISFPSRRTLAHATNAFKTFYSKILGGEEIGAGETHFEEDNVPFRNRQTEFSGLEGQDTIQNLYTCPGLEHQIVMGPWKKQIAYTVPFLGAINIANAWSSDINNTKERQTDHPVPDPSSAAPQHSCHEGWLLNIGQKIQCLAWAPHAGSKQYLAIACHCKKQQRQHVSAPCSQRAPAFSPSAPYPSCLQIWRFSARNASSQGVSTLDKNQRPILVTTLCTNWGDIRQIEWVPTGAGYGHHEQSLNIIGQLGVVSSDGKARLLDIPVNDDDSRLNLKVERPILELSPPPYTVFSCLKFASGSDLIVGGVDGQIWIYNILQSVREETPEPYMVYQLQNTYIMSLCVAFDSPNFLASCSASGELLITDLRCPQQDRLPVHKARVPTSNLVYLPFSRSFVTTTDSAGNSESKGTTHSMVISHQLRNFHTTATIARLPEASGTATALAASRWHPCVLAANSKGTVFATNGIRRLLPSARSEKYGKSDGWLHKLCEYEWRPLQPPSFNLGNDNDGTNSRSEVDGDIDIFHGRDTRPGVSRFHEGFKPTKVDLITGGVRRRGLPVTADPSTQVLFEEEQAATALCWNPNPATSSWAAIGWGSGIVRVQDLSHDGV